jgi:hypothetical protein
MRCSSRNQGAELHTPTHTETIAGRQYRNPRLRDLQIARPFHAARDNGLGSVGRAVSAASASGSTALWKITSRWMAKLAK